jgi:O-antigen ligase
MGIIVGAFVVVWAAGLPDSPASRKPPTTRNSRNSRRFQRLLLLVVAGLVALYLAPGEAQTYVQVRAGDLTAAYNGLVNGTGTMNSNGINQTSGSVRADLDRATLGIFQEHWSTGVGANQVPVYEEQHTGFALAGHNTYLETAAVGGVFGIAALDLYLISFRRFVKLAAEKGVEVIALSCTMLVFVSMAAMALVLTMDYNSILWLPLALVAGITQGETYCTAKNLS